MRGIASITKLFHFIEIKDGVVKIFNNRKKVAITEKWIL
jgi:hypothetical protein